MSLLPSWYSSWVHWLPRSWLILYVVPPPVQGLAILASSPISLVMLSWDLPVWSLLSSYRSLLPCSIFCSQQSWAQLLSPLASPSAWEDATRQHVSLIAVGTLPRALRRACRHNRLYSRAS